MGLALWLSALTLALAFGVAGASKLRSPNATADTAREFGLSRVAAAKVAMVLPLVELAVAAGLLMPFASVMPVARRVAAAGALVLLGAFSIAITRSLRAGRSPVCHCFGSLGAKPIGTDSLVRNGSLAVLALVVLVFG